MATTIPMDEDTTIDILSTSVFDELTTTFFNSTTNTTTLPKRDVDKGIATDVIVYISVGLFGVLGNGFAVFIIGTNRKMREKVCNFFILNQSVVDLLGSFFLMVNNPAIVSQNQPSNWFAAQLYCRFWGSSYFMWAMFELSSFNLVAITIERYAEVVHPFLYPDLFSRKRAQIGLAMVWVIGIIFPMLPNAVPSPPGPNGICNRYGGWPNVVTAKFVGVLIYIVLMVAPLIIMIFAYTKMVLVVKTKVNPTMDGNMSAAEKARQERKAKARRNLIKTLISVCAAFFVCWIMNHTYYFLTTLGLQLSFTNTFYYLTVYLAFVNCVINPIIYTAQYREFQIAVKHHLKCFFKKTEDKQQGVSTVA